MLDQLILIILYSHVPTLKISFMFTEAPRGSLQIMTQQGIICLETRKKKHKTNTRYRYKKNI